MRRKNPDDRLRKAQRRGEYSQAEMAQYRTELIRAGSLATVTLEEVILPAHIFAGDILEQYLFSTMKLGAASVFGNIPIQFLGEHEDHGHRVGTWHDCINYVGLEWSLLGVFFESDNWKAVEPEIDALDYFVEDEETDFEIFARFGADLFIGTWDPEIRLFLAARYAGQHPRPKF